MIFTGCYVSMTECTCPGDTGHILHGCIELVLTIANEYALSPTDRTRPIDTGLRGFAILMIFTGCYVSMTECTCPGDTGHILHRCIELVNSISFYQALPTAYGTISVNTCHSRFALGMTMASSR